MRTWLTRIGRGAPGFALAVCGLATRDAPAAPSSAPSPLEFSWEAPGECPDRARVLTTIERYLGRPVDEATRERLRVDATITRASSRRVQLALRIETTSGQRARSIDGETCELLADTTALIVAITIDPTVGERIAELSGAGREATDAETPDAPEREDASDASGTAADEREPPESTPNATAPAEREPPARSRVARARPRGAFQLGGGGGAGVLPGFAPNLRVTAGALWKRARVDATGEFWFDKSAAHPERPAAGGEFRLWSLGVRGCGVPSVGRFEFPVCGGVDVGAMTGVGTGITDPQDERLVWVAANAEVMAVFAPWRRFAFWVGTRLLVPLARPSFEIEGLGVVYAVAPAGFNATLGVEVRFL